MAKLNVVQALLISVTRRLVVLREIGICLINLSGFALFVSKIFITSCIFMNSSSVYEHLKPEIFHDVIKLSSVEESNSLVNNVNNFRSDFRTFSLLVISLNYVDM